jgi:hypothetical protein
MSKQVYFVIGVDVDEGTAFIDDESFIARFGKDEQVWDTELREWVSDEGQGSYHKALDILNSKPLTSD